jgi:FliI/YscN family ATPase
MNTRLSDLRRFLPKTQPHSPLGTIVAARGYTAVATLPGAAIGDICCIERTNGSTVQAEVIAFDRELIHLAPFESLEGTAPGSTVINMHTTASFPLPDEQTLPGAILNGCGEPIQLLQRSPAGESPGGKVSLYSSPPCPLTRAPIAEQMLTGIPLIDLLLPIGYGQRIGLFAGPGAGKSTLLGVITQRATVDICVVGLIGERGREVQEFVEHSLGEAGRKKCVVIVSTSDESPCQRKNAALTATAVAEHYRSQGKRVLLLIDSLTRTARAIREIGLSTGEPPVRHGYTASVFTELPELLERTGNDAHGSITAIYTVLSNHESDIDPLAEELQSLLDGHFVLSADLSARGRYPAIDLTQSVSRLARRLLSPDQGAFADMVREMYSRLSRDRDLVLFGGRADEELQRYLEIEEEVDQLLRRSCGVGEMERVRAEIMTLLTGKSKDLLDT